MRHHAQGVNAGIGAAGSVDSTNRRKEIPQSFLKALLHGEGVGLGLPAVVSGTLERHVEFEFDLRLHVYFRQGRGRLGSGRQESMNSSA